MKRSFLFLLFLLLAGFVFSQTDVYTPTLKTPADNAVDQMPNVVLSWSAISGSLNLTYELELDTTAAFNSPLKKDTVMVLITGYKTRNLFFGKDYFWRVRALDNGELSAWTPTRKFAIFNEVALSKPNDNEDDQMPNEAISWKAKVGTDSIKGITHFDYEMDTTNSFSSPLLIAGSVAKNVFSYTPSNLLFNQKYFWRIKARHSQGTSGWSVVRSFTVINKFDLTSPANNATGQDLDVTLKWDAVTGILMYEFQIAEDQTFNTLVYHSEVTTNSADASMLIFGTNYYWRTRAIHAADTSEWTDPWKFTTTDAVKLKSPADAAINVNHKPLFTWFKMGGITEYWFQLADNQSFNTPLYNTVFGDSVTSFQSTKKLNAQSTYYWRMRAVLNNTVNDTTSWGQVFSFTTVNPTGIGNEPASLKVNVYPNPTSGLTTLTLSGKEESLVQMELLNLLGKIIKAETIQITRGENKITLSFNDLSNGVYILRFSLDGKQAFLKLIIDK
ncbi:MAG: T9SS type A sorting domain-containing protein [Bacteroidetes bacterium]|nr:T9SS type A sorting domain-containing protein [Bacteroidota bacterium]